jgi:hypothetical protein
MYIVISRSGVHRLQHQQLGHQVVGRLADDGAADEDDPLVEELRDRRHGAHAVAGALLELHVVDGLGAHLAAAVVRPEGELRTHCEILR